MNVTPIRLQTTAERHVQFSEFVEVRHIEPKETAPVQPSLYAQRLERELRNRPDVEPQPAQPAQSKPVRVMKNALHTVAMVCGALILPSFLCLIMGPIGLVVPAALTSVALTCALLGGRPTETMERARAERAAAMNEYDPR
jgi:hypothetical protein